MNPTQADYWDSHEDVQDFLAAQLRSGCLSLVLGAGVSAGVGLPDWDTLIERLAEDLCVTLPSGLSAPQRAEYLLHKGCDNDRVRLAQAVHQALYRKADLSLENLMGLPTLTALGALAMRSSRGAATAVVTFNYDDVLEQFLRFLGFTVSSIGQMPGWASGADVVVYHPHGLLEYADAAPSRGVVLTQADYDEIVGDSKQAWHAMVRQVFCTTTPLFIGLSGNDSNLTQLLKESQAMHVSRGEQHCNWGVRFTTNADDPMSVTWNTRGVVDVVLKDWGGLSTWLLQICQRAAVGWEGS